jgi:long-chain fatty acid transport protein
MRSNKLALLAIACLYLALARPIYPDVNHYRNILVGDRAATMGGAFTAVADDASGTYYNPSGIAFCEGGGLSASANVLHYQSSTYQKAIRDYDWVRNSEELIPNFFGIIKTWGRHSFGASIAVPDSFTQNQDQVFNNLPAAGSSPALQRYAFNLHTQDATYLIGPSYSYRINDHTSIGVTLSYHYRSSRTQDQQTIWYSSTDYEIDNNIAELTENGLEPKIGFLAKITDKISVGIVLDHTFIVSSKYTDQMTNKARTSSDLTFDTIEDRSIRNTPTHIGLGFAFRPTEPLLLAMDFDIYIPPNSDAFFPDGYKNVVNVAIGGEYKINKRNAVRLGLFTNKSNMPEPSASTSLVSHVDLYGLTTGYTLSYMPTSFTLGFIYSHGSGRSQVYSSSSVALNTYSEAITGIFSAAYNFE